MAASPSTACSPMHGTTGPTEVDLRDAIEGTSSMMELWSQNLLCDVILRPADGPDIPAHKVVLAASSGFFRALLVGAGTHMKEGQASHCPLTLPLPELEHRWLMTVIQALYSRRIEICWKDLDSIIAASSFLEVAPILDACSQYILKNLNLGNCLEALAIASAHNYPGLQASVKEYVCARFSQLMASPHRPSLLRLPAPLLQDLLQADHLDVDTELEVAEVVVEWVSADPPTRQQHVPSLISAVRLAPISATCAFADSLGSDADSVASSLGSSPLQHSILAELAGVGGGGVERSGSFTELANAAAAAGGQCMGGLAGVALMASSSSRKHNATALLVAGGRDEGWRCLKSTERYDPLTDQWMPGPVLPVGLSFAAAAAAEREVVAVGGSMFTASAMRLDPRQGVWRHCTPPLTPRIHTAAASLAGSVYVLGGRSQVQQLLPTVEQYQPDTDTWEAISSMLVPRYALGSAALGGRIYAVGGQGRRGLESTVECFDPESQGWQLLGARLSSARKYLGVGALGGRLYVVGGVDSGRVRLGSMEALDPREGRWTRLPATSKPRSSCGVAALQGRLYVIGGNCGDDAIDGTVECYVPTMDRWIPCASLGCGRSGLSVTTV